MCEAPYRPSQPGSSPMSSLGVISDFITSFHSNPLENEMILRLFPGQELPESLVRRHGEEQIQPHTGWLGGFLGGQAVKNPPPDTGDPGSILRLGRSPGGGHGNLLQYSHLESPVDRGVWWATVHGVAESDSTEQLSTVWRRREDSFLESASICFKTMILGFVTRGYIL